MSNTGVGQNDVTKSYNNPNPVRTLAHLNSTLRTPLPHRTEHSERAVGIHLNITASKNLGKV